MKLNVKFEHDPSTGREKPVITDDRGEVMPCVQGVLVDYTHNDATRVLITLVVNRKDVTLGEPAPPF